MDHQSNHTIPLRHTSGRDSLRGWSPIIHGAVSSEAGTNRVGGSSPGEDIRAIQPPMGSVVNQCQTFQSTQLTRELTHSIDWLGMSRSCPLRRNRSIHDDPSRTANAPRTPQLINGDVNACCVLGGIVRLSHQAPTPHCDCPSMPQKIPFLFPKCIPFSFLGSVDPPHPPAHVYP
jgi:hypothetical protein